MAFWSAAALISAIVVGFVLWPLMSRRGDAPEVEGLHDQQIYRDQLAEIDRDAERGLLGETEADQARLEISRRLLEADQRYTSAVKAGDGQLSMPLAGLLAACLLLATGGLYYKLGAQGLPDQPLAERLAARAEAIAARPTQEQVEEKFADQLLTTDDQEPEYLALLEQLRSTVAKRPDDLQGYEYLAANEANIGNFRAAWRAKARALQLKGEAATASDFIDLAELMIVATGGYVSPKAEIVLGQAVRLNPDLPRGRYYTGLALAQNGRPDLTFEVWSELVQRGPEDAPWVMAIKSQLPEIARQIGRTDELDLAGPDASDIEAAGELDDAERAEMVNSMVERLSDRLASEGGSAAEWARLIRALGVLQRVERAEAIWKEAQEVFAADPQSLAQINQAAAEAGLTQ